MTSLIPKSFNIGKLQALNGKYNLPKILIFFLLECSYFVISNKYCQLFFLK